MNLCDRLSLKTSSDTKTYIDSCGRIMNWIGKQLDLEKQMSWWSRLERTFSISHSLSADSEQLKFGIKM